MSRVTNPRNRVSVSEAEAILGRPCPHEGGSRTRADYCRRCANSVAQRRLVERTLLVAADGTVKPQKDSLI